MLNEEEEHDRTNVSQLYNLNTVDSRILDDTNDAMACTMPWKGMSAQGTLGGN